MRCHRRIGQLPKFVRTSEPTTVTLNKCRCSWDIIIIIIIIVIIILTWKLLHRCYLNRQHMFLPMYALMYTVYVFMGLIHDCKCKFKVNCCNVIVIFQVKGHKKSWLLNKHVLFSLGWDKMRSAGLWHTLAWEQNTVTKVHRDFFSSSRVRHGASAWMDSVYTA